VEKIHSNLRDGKPRDVLIKPGGGKKRGRGGYPPPKGPITDNTPPKRVGGIIPQKRLKTQTLSEGRPEMRDHSEGGESTRTFILKKHYLRLSDKKVATTFTESH